MGEAIKNIIFRIFGRLLAQSGKQIERQNEQAKGYESTEDINLTAIIAGKLATLAVTDAVIAVEGDNKRAETLQDILNKRVIDRARKIVSTALGIGGVALVPYYVNGKICVDAVPQNRFFVTEKIGDEITKAVILANYIVRDSKKYMRWTDYALENGACVIRNRATIGESPCSLDILPEWKGIAEEIRIPGAEHLLLGYMKCPADNRRPDGAHGVPITYGCDKIIERCIETLNEETNEYKLKRGFVGVDGSLFGNDDKLPESGLFKTFKGDGKIDDMWHEYSPEIRYAAYSARVQELFELLEKAVGTSKGILTAPETATTATEVRRAQHDTWALVGEVRKSFEHALEDLIYALDVLCNYYSISPAGEYTTKYDWDMSMLEDTDATWQQMKDGYSMRIRSKAELRSWQTGETLEEAQKAVDEIAATDPGVQDLIGNAE